MINGRLYAKYGVHDLPVTTTTAARSHFGHAFPGHMSSQILYESPQQSPIEEDISRAHSHHEPGASPTAKTERQRQKQRAEGPFVDGVDEESSSDEGEDKRGSYPPNNDEAEESRRIEEVCA